MSALEEGPSIGLMEGCRQTSLAFWLSFGPEKCLADLQGYGSTLCSCIKDELVNENTDHHSSEYIYWYAIQ